MTTISVETEYISACCNCTYNCADLGEDFIVYGANQSLAVYDIEEGKTVSTLAAHNGRINCVRFVKNSGEQFLATCCSKGTLILWEKTPESTCPPKFEEKCRITHDSVSLTVVDSVRVPNGRLLLGCISTDSRVLIYEFKDGSEFTLMQEMPFKKMVALDLVFHSFPSSNENEDQGAENVVLGLGMDNGSLRLYTVKENGKEFDCCTTLLKHEDWVRCVNFITLDNGDVLLASGGQDSFIAIWRFTKSKSAKSEFEFQVHHFKDYLVIFDSMIIGHEGWINSLSWNPAGKLISCSSDQSTIIWSCTDDIWIENSRFGVMGGQIPGGYGAKLLNDTVICYGFQGAIQVWRQDMDDELNSWNVQPSVTGHFSQVSDMDYDTGGNYIVTTSHDQTTRVHAPWGISRWHEISRPQIHGHDLFSVRLIKHMIVSGAEEKILRAFQPPDIFFKNLEDISEITLDHKSEAKAASIPALGLSNQSDEQSVYQNVLELPVETRLDDDFLRSQTLWPEISKLYGHVYEISCIGASPVDLLIASGSQSSKPQFSSIILWCASKWKNLGEFPFHKLNVEGLEFSPDGRKLLSVSRDRTWAVWDITKNTSENDTFTMSVKQSENYHTRTLWVGTWSPCGKYFVTGGRDKKIALWRECSETGRYVRHCSRTFTSSVSAAAINTDGIIVVGLESGIVEIVKYDPENPEEDGRIQSLASLNHSQAHHDIVKRLRFNPKEKYQFASASADHIVKIHEIRQCS